MAQAVLAWRWLLWSALVYVAMVGAWGEARVLLVGHRGTPSWRPEETLGGYELAAALGADFLEADLCATKDGHLVCRHECELSETTDVASREEFAGLYRVRGVPELRKRRTSAEGGWYTEDFTLAQLQSLRARERLPEEVRSHAFDGLSPVVSLEEFLQLTAALDTAPSQPPTVADARQATAAPLGVYIETKTPTYFSGIGLPVEQLLLEALAAQGLDKRCSDAYEAYYPDDVGAWVEACGVILQSFEDNLMVQVWQMHPYYPIIQLLGAPDEQMRGSDVLYGDLMTEEGLAGLATWVTGIGPAKTSLLEYNVTSVATTADEESSASSGDEDPCAGLAFHYSSTGLLERAHEAQLLVHPYTFRKEEYYLDCAFGNDMERELEAFFALGVDGVFTDSMDVAVAARERMYPESGSYVATLILGLYVVTGVTCAAYAVFMVASLVVWVTNKVRSRRAPLVITEEE